jgi:carboxynorspermidine decarboxylase
MAIDYTKIPSPCFILEKSRLQRNLELIREVQQRAGVTIILALKGFAMWRVFPFIGTYLKGAAGSSLYEARLIYEEMGCPAHTYAPAYLPDDFEEIIRYSSHLTFNSFTEYARYRDRLPGNMSAGIRVNPEYSDVKVDLYNPASPGSRLGVLVDDFEKNGLPEGVEGLHFHTLCESSAQATEKAVAAFEQRFSSFFSKIKWVNFGGGHLMTRRDYDVKHLVKVLRRFRERYPHLEVILEPGSAIAWETGELVATVLDIVKHRNTQTAIMDVSFTAHMPDTLEMPYRPKILGATDPEEGKLAYRIGGVSCLAGDYMTEYGFDRELAVGDRLVFWDMMHYTMVKTTMFNGVAHPGIAIWHEDDRLELIRRFDFEDYKKRLS